MNIELNRKLREIFNKHDPVGMCIRHKNSREEYDPEIEKIALIFRDCKDYKEFCDKIYMTFKKEFSEDLVGPKSKYEQFSKEVFKTLQSHIGDA